MIAELSFFKSKQKWIKSKITITAFQQQILGSIYPIDMSILWIVEMTARIYRWRLANWNIIWYSIKSARVKQVNMLVFIHFNFLVYNGQ